MAFKPCIYVFLTIFALLTSELNCAHNINTSLSQMCPTLATIGASNKNLMKIEKGNIDMFLKYMTSTQAKAIANGTFGEVFISSSFNDIEQTKPRLDAVKLVKVAEDENSDEEEEQIMFEGEVKATFQLHKLDPQHLFFPAFRYCVEVTTEFQNFIQNQANLQNSEYVEIEDGKAPFLIATQKLDQELWELFSQITEKKAESFDIVNRIQLGINLFRGVILMNTKFIHCDLKPENLMIKKLTEAEANLISQQGLKVIEGKCGNYYQIFYIDFGMVQQITNQVIQCPGGTPGYLAKEYFQKGVSHDQADIFGVGITLLNSETTTIRTNWVSDLYEFIQVSLRNRKATFTQTQVTQLSQMPLLKALMVMMDKEENRDDIKQKVLAFYPNAQADITRIFKDKDFKTVKPSSFIIGNVYLFEAFVDSTLPYLPEFDMVFNRDENARIKMKTDSLNHINTQLNSMDEQNPDHAKYTNYVEILQLEKDIINKEILLKKNYWMLLLETIKDKTKRISGQNMLDQLKTLLLDYKTENQEQLKRYDEVKMTKINETISQEHDQAIKQKYTDIVQGRKQKMATIYGEGHQRRRRMIRV